MSTYAIGDIQGCYDELQALLAAIHFDETRDVLWFTGDLINRGGKSLETLRFVKRLAEKNCALTVLGNHDLHLLAVACHAALPKSTDTFADILTAPDRDELLDWLRFQPLIHYDASLDFILVHAGLAPQWRREEALACASEVEQALRSENYPHFLAGMYGNTPHYWHPDLRGQARLRTIVNYLTRMRYVDSEGGLELAYKGTVGGQNQAYCPWFETPLRHNAGERIIFGHWAALKGDTHGAANVFALDTGCCWGNCLTALRLQDLRYFSVRCDSQNTAILTVETE